MLVRVFHTNDLSAGYDTEAPGPGQREVFAYTHPDPAADAADHGPMLQHIFMLFNIGHDQRSARPSCDRLPGLPIAILVGWRCRCPRRDLLRLCQRGMAAIGCAA